MLAESSLSLLDEDAGGSTPSRIIASDATNDVKKEKATMARIIRVVIGGGD
jgi:hypothetical protein